MVAGSVARRSGSGRYRRHPLPAIVLLSVLGVVAAVVWIKVISSDGDSGAAVNCAPPASLPTAAAGQPAPTLGQALGQEALDRTAPSPAAIGQVRVLNAAGQKGLATQVTESLRSLGFSQVAPAANDPLYPTGDMDCQAQIRFGQLGSATARTLSLVEPCAELIRDNRQDAGVDLVLGKRFQDLRPNQQAREVLDQLANWAVQHPDASAALQANTATLPQIDATLLTQARHVTC